MKRVLSTWIVSFVVMILLQSCRFTGPITNWQWDVTHGKDGLIIKQ